MKYKLKMTLLSDTIPGNGNGSNGLIDRDIVFDRYGIPYIPAKRIKGVLRQTAENLRYSQNYIGLLFGNDGESKGIMIIDNGIIEDYDKYYNTLHVINDEINETSEVANDLIEYNKEYFSYLRTQTAVENGKARENSVRVSRVLKKGLVFNFDIEITDKYINLKKVNDILSEISNNSTNKNLLNIDISTDSYNILKNTLGLKKYFSDFIQIMNDVKDSDNDLLQCKFNIKINKKNKDDEKVIDFFKEMLRSFNEDKSLENGYKCNINIEKFIKNSDLIIKSAQNLKKIYKKSKKKDIKLSICIEKIDINEFIKNVICATSSFGSSRNRGFGEIELSLDVDKEQNDNSTKPEEDETHSKSNESDKIGKLTFVVHNLEDLLVTYEVGKKNESCDFIPGNFILGALASRFLKKNKVGTEFNDIFLSGKVSFGNLYPTQGDENDFSYYTPVPLSIKKNKDEEYENFIKLDDEERKSYLCENEKFKGNLNFYYCENDDCLINDNFHLEPHNKCSDDFAKGHSTNDKGDFFHYLSINSDCYFMGSIIGPISYLETLSCLIKKDKIIRLGKSKTSQYGKCEIINVENVCDCSNSIKIDKKGEKQIVLESDLILRNEFGHNEASEMCLKKYFKKIGLDVEKCFIKSINVGGFKGVWKLPKIQKSAFKKGSSFVLKNNNDYSILLPKILGEYQEEGYGRLKSYLLHKILEEYQEEGYGRLETCFDHEFEEFSYLSEQYTLKTNDESSDNDSNLYKFLLTKKMLNNIDYSNFKEKFIDFNTTTLNKILKVFKKEDDMQSTNIEGLCETFKDEKIRKLLEIDDSRKKKDLLTTVISNYINDINYVNDTYKIDEDFLYQIYKKIMIMKIDNIRYNIRKENNGKESNK